MSAIANVLAYVDAATAHVERTTCGLGRNVVVDAKPIGNSIDVAYLELADLRALMERLEEVCPEHVACESCERTLCRSCKVGEPADCGHRDAELLCEDCRHTECSGCRSLMRAEFGVDRYFRSAS